MKHQTLIQALKNWRKKSSYLFNRRVCEAPALDALIFGRRI
jgi:hypothetical protein